jgi:hypothetical protein
MIDAISHLIHRDYEAIVEDFVVLQFIPPGTDLKPILPVLAKVFDQALAGGGAKGINFQVGGWVGGRAGGWVVLVNALQGMLLHYFITHLAASANCCRRPFNLVLPRSPRPPFFLSTAGPGR